MAVWLDGRVAAIPRRFVSLVRPSRRALRLLWHLSSIRCGHCRVPLEADVVLPGVCLFWIVAGRGRLQIGDVDIDLRPGPDCWLIGYDRPRRWLPLGPRGFVTRALTFNGPGLESWWEELELAAHPRFRLARPARLEQVYQRLRRLVQRQPGDWEWAIHLQLSALLGELLRARHPATPADSAAVPESIARVLNALEVDPTRDWRVRELAACAGLSYSTFAKLFARVMGESPHAYLQRSRLELARGLLADPDLRIKEVAARLHFPNECYFTYFFHKHTGLSPREFRRRLGPSLRG